MASDEPVLARVIREIPGNRINDGEGSRLPRIVAPMVRAAWAG